MKVEDVLEVLQAVSKLGTAVNQGLGVSAAEHMPDPGGAVRILILQRGWIVVGRVRQHGVQLTVTNGFVVRRWGTTSGLGQLATFGPLPETTLDAIPTLYTHELEVIAALECTAEKWTVIGA